MLIEYEILEKSYKKIEIGPKRNTVLNPCVTLTRGQSAIPKILQRINDVLPPEGKKTTALVDVRPSRGTPWMIL